MSFSRKFTSIAWLALSGCVMSGCGNNVEPDRVSLDIDVSAIACLRDKPSVCIRMPISDAKVVVLAMERRYEGQTGADGRATFEFATANFLYIGSVESPFLQDQMNFSGEATGKSNYQSLTASGQYEIEFPPA